MTLPVLKNQYREHYPASWVRQNLQPVFDGSWTRSQIANLGGMMDARLGSDVVAGGNIDVYKLRHELEPVIRAMVRKNVLDELVGITIAGDWIDEEVQAKIITPTGMAAPYTDHGNIPLVNYGKGKDTRNYVRFMAGWESGLLERERQSRDGVDDEAEKRAAVALTLEQAREEIGYYGYSDGVGRTFGLFNEPNLPPYDAVSKALTAMTFEELIDWFGAAFSELMISSGQNVDMNSTVRFAVPATHNGIFTKRSPSGDGMTFGRWLKENYPNITYSSDIRFAGANGGADVAYLIADDPNSGSQAADETILQIVPTKYNELGTEESLRSRSGVAINATAGMFVLRGFLIKRFTGV